MSGSAGRSTLAVILMWGKTIVAPLSITGTKMAAGRPDPANWVYSPAQARQQHTNGCNCDECYKVASVADWEALVKIARVAQLSGALSKRDAQYLEQKIDSIATKDSVRCMIVWIIQRLDVPGEVTVR